MTTAAAQRTASHNGHTPSDATQPPAKAKKPAPKLTAKLARDLADADARITDLERQLANERGTRKKLRTRARGVLKSGEAQTAGGYLVKLTAYKVRKFSLTEYEAAGHKLTAAMRRCISRSARETWTVKRVK